MSSRADLKLKAKESLKGKLGDAIAITLLFGLITFMVLFFTEFILEIFSIHEFAQGIITEIISILVSGLLSFGYCSYFLKISREENPNIQELWSKTNLLISYIIVTVLISIFTTLWTLLFIIPGIIATINYSMTYYILLDEDISPLEAISKSKKLMIGHKLDYFLLNLSFIGWILLGIFTCGILYIWLIPYIYVTNLHFYNELLIQK